MENCHLEEEFWKRFCSFLVRPIVCSKIVNQVTAGRVSKLVAKVVTLCAVSSGSVGQKSQFVIFCLQLAGQELLYVTWSQGYISKFLSYKNIDWKTVHVSGFITNMSLRQKNSEFSPKNFLNQFVDVNKKKEF